MTKPVPDVLIIGCGPAGMSALLWAQELGLTSTVVEARAEAGGQLLRTFNRIDNHLGDVFSNGLEVRERFLKQLDLQNHEILFETSVLEIQPAEKFAILNDGTDIEFKSLLLATGVRRRKLGIPGELEFENKGILFSGKRDGKQASGKTAVIVGGGDAAFENALIIAGFASRVILIHRRSEFTARPAFISEVSANPKIEIVTDSEVIRIDGNALVEELTILDKKSGVETQIDAEIVVVRTGVAPNSEIIAPFVETDERDYVKISVDGSTNCDGIFAAGDVANPISPTISSAVGMGATAIKKIRSLLR